MTHSIDDGIRGLIPALPVPANASVVDPILSKSDGRKELEIIENDLIQLESKLGDRKVPEEVFYEMQLQLARKLRKLVCSGGDSVTPSQVVDQGVLERHWIPLMFEWMKLDHRPAVQVEMLWALSKIGSDTSDGTHVFNKYKCAYNLVPLLETKHEDVFEQTLWIIGKVVKEGSEPRDIVLCHGLLDHMTEHLNKNAMSMSLLRIFAWTLSNICDSQPRPIQDVGAVLPLISKLLNSVDAEVLSHACWSISHLCDGGPISHIKAVVEADVGWRLVQLLMHRSWRVTKPALRAIGNIVCAEDETDYTQQMIEFGCVPCLQQLISHKVNDIQKEACWTLSNIAAGTIPQIQSVIDCEAIPSLVKLSKNPQVSTEVKNEACWVVLNATSCGSDEQIEYLVANECVAVLSELLVEPSMVMMALEGLERILQVGEDKAKGQPQPEPNTESSNKQDKFISTNLYANLLPANKIEAILNHKSTNISRRASRIWKDHFVLCAICNESFAKQSNKAHFCSECKCFVCSKCNCTVFHLDYQEELWKDLTTDKKGTKKGEKGTSQNAGNNANNNSNQESKKSKKKKKDKKKDKKKSSSGAVSSGGLSVSSSPEPPISTEAMQESPSDFEDDDSDDGLFDSSNLKVKLAIDQKQTSKQASLENSHMVPSKRKSNTGKESSSFDLNINGQLDDRNTPRRKKEDQESASDCHTITPLSMDESNTSPSLHNEGDAKQKKQDQTFKPSKDNSGSSGGGTTASGLNNQAKASDKFNGHTSDLVSYLERTGSILALAEMLDDEEGDDTSDVTDEDMRLLQEAAKSQQNYKKRK